MRTGALRFSLGAVFAVAAIVVACGGNGDDPIRQGRGVYGDVCSACHGDAGQGGVGPALSAVRETFPSCSDQIEWVALGSDGWRGAHGGTYGSTAKPVQGGMPGHAEALTPDEVAAVVAFERVRYGGGESSSVLVDCGLAPAG
jgi:mono/diheme cytochrome c family protein